MKTKKLFVLFITLSMGILLVAGCATSPKPSADPASMGPAWVMKGGGAFDVEKGKVFYGVGIASGIKNKALLRQTADNRARAELRGNPCKRLHGFYNCRRYVKIFGRAACRNSFENLLKDNSPWCGNRRPVDGSLRRVYVFTL
ncbi:MAG: hypothetical protein JRE29_14245 [Deltaproteobacteria bacterium]|nr:hypothetical protein [Deltaproteobacteria bacterium]